jgi:hypothetical protein
MAVNTVNNFITNCLHPVWDFDKFTDGHENKGKPYQQPKAQLQCVSTRQSRSSNYSFRMPAGFFCEMIRQDMQSRRAQLLPDCFKFGTRIWKSSFIIRFADCETDQHEA